LRLAIPSLGVCLLPLVMMLSGCEPSAPAIDARTIAINNEAVGLMGQYRNEEARLLFSELVQTHPEQTELRVNLAIATLNRQRAGDEEAALVIARDTLKQDPAQLRARYVAGLAELYLGRVEAAAVELDAVADAIADDAHASYFAAQAASQLGRAERAQMLYRRALAIDPYLRSAYYGIAQLLRQNGDADGAREMLRDYQKLQGNPRAHLAEFRYTRMGPLAEAQVIGNPQPARAALPEGPVFADATELAPVDLVGAGLSLTTADFDGDGRLDLFLAGGEHQENRLWRGIDGGFAGLAGHPLTEVENVRAAAWGDVDNDGRLDLFLCRDGSNQLGAISGETWEDVATASGLTDARSCVDAAMIDADHDGDLDIHVLNAEGGNELYSNNLDGSFRALSESSPLLAGDQRSGRQLLVGDLDADRDADLLLIPASPPPQLLLNDRLWDYREDAGIAAISQADWRAATLADPLARGRPWLITVAANGELQSLDLMTPYSARLLATSSLPPAERPQLIAQDFDGDGSTDILLWNEHGWELYGFDDRAQRLRLLQSAQVPLRALTSYLREPGLGPELVGVLSADQGSRLVRWPAGPGRYGFLALAPSGRADAGAGTRSNASGLGTTVLLRVADRWSILDQLDRDSAPGQSLQPLAIGLGGAAQADFVELQWSDGVYQTELALAGGQLHAIAEEQRQLASCPVLFAWNGERFEFVSDVLGVGGIGFFLAPGVYSEPRPWEFFKLPQGALQPRDGRYQLKLTEPMEEAAYLDSARLHVYDLPPGWDLSLDERMHTGGGPAPAGTPIYFRATDVLPLRRVLDGQGQSLDEALALADAKAVDPGVLDLRFIGRLAHEQIIDLELARPISDARGLTLVADAWVEYPYSQTVFAAWQAGADYTPFSLEARVHGTWQPVHAQFGYPAGMPREFSLPLDAVPAGSEALRLRGNLEVYWDRIRVIQSQPAPAELRHQPLPPIQAQVARIGFPKRSTLAQRRPQYDYDDRSAFWDTRYMAGDYTAFGPALELVAQTDDALAIIGPGDEIHLEFDAPPGPAPGWRRVLVLEVRGYAKDMDLYTRDGETLDPLPRTSGIPDSARRDDLNRQYNTRFQDGR
jgi:tetratricopeptide (TPR) repeat protein